MRPARTIIAIDCGGYPITLGIMDWDGCPLVRKDGRWVQGIEAVLNTGAEICAYDVVFNDGVTIRTKAQWHVEMPDPVAIHDDDGTPYKISWAGGEWEFSGEQIFFGYSPAVPSGADSRPRVDRRDSMLDEPIDTLERSVEQLTKQLSDIDKLDLGRRVDCLEVLLQEQEVRKASFVTGTGVDLEPPRMVSDAEGDLYLVGAETAEAPLSIKEIRANLVRALFREGGTDHELLCRSLADLAKVDEGCPPAPEPGSGFQIGNAIFTRLVDGRRIADSEDNVWFVLTHEQARAFARVVNPPQPVGRYAVILDEGGTPIGVEDTARRVVYQFSSIQPLRDADE